MERNGTFAIRVDDLSGAAAQDYRWNLATAGNDGPVRGE